MEGDKEADEVTDGHNRLQELVKRQRHQLLRCLLHVPLLVLIVDLMMMVVMMMMMMMVMKMMMIILMMMMMMI